MTEIMAEKREMCRSCRVNMVYPAERCDYEDNGCCEPLALCEDCGGSQGMFASKKWGGHYHYGCHPFVWDFYDAFKKFGFGDGNSRRNYTYIVEEAIEAIGYTVYSSSWGCHNRTCIENIIRNSDGENVYGLVYDCKLCACSDDFDDPVCPHHRWLSGYSHDRTFANTLPQDICETLHELRTSAKKIVGFEHGHSEHLQDLFWR